MKHRFWLFQRRGVFYVEDTLTHRQESLGTRHRAEAERIRLAKESAVVQTHANLAIGKAYLAAHEPQMVRRTWQVVMEEFVSRGLPTTRERKQRGMRSRPFRLLAEKKLVETTADDFRQVIASGGGSTNLFLRCLHNLA